MKKTFSFRHVVFRFRRFTRKRYAAFASLHRLVSMGRVTQRISDLEMLKAGRKIALSGLAAAASCSLLAAAESETPGDVGQLTIDEVLVVAERAELQSQNLRVIHRLSSAQIAALPVVAVSDLLDYLPGVDARARGAGGSQTDISLRGGTFDQVLILLNGHNITDTQTGHYSFDLPVDIDMIDHIELLTGTGMSQFGLSSFSGAVNIVTKSGVQNPIHHKPDSCLQYWGVANLQAGNYGLFHPGLSGGIGRRGQQDEASEWSVAGSASYNQSTGYIDNTDYKICDIFLNAAVRNKTGKWNMQMASEYKGVGANSFYSLKYPDQFDATKTAFASLDWEQSWKRWTLRAAASYRAHHDRFELFRQTWKPVETPDWYTNHNYHLTQTTSAALSLKYASAIGNTTAGVELRNENILSNVLGEARTNSSGSVFVYEKNRLNVNYFLQQSVFRNSLSASVGVSGNWNSMFQNNIAWTANLAYELPCRLRFYANANQGVRLPTFTDLYYKSATQLANPELKAERAITTELGLRWADEHWQVQAAGYYRWGRNIIDWVLMPDDERWQSKNLTAVNAAGTDVQASYKLNQWLRRVSLSYSFCTVDKRADGFMSKYALDYLRHKFVAQVDHGIWKGLGASWNLTWQKRDGEYTNRDGVVESYKPVLLFDLRLYWQYRGITVSADACNLLGTRYYDYGGIEQPGRSFRAAVKYEF